MAKNDKVSSFAFSGNWDSLLPLLKDDPDLVNAASEAKGYTPLHQAAWHGASLSVIGELLHLGADRSARTHNKQQTASDIAMEKHRDRLDLAYVLAERRLAIAQLVRKVASRGQELFSDYDGNQIMADRLVACFGFEPCPISVDELKRRLESAFVTLTGVGLTSSSTIMCTPCEGFEMSADTGFWTSRFLPLVQEYASQADTMVIEKGWAVVSDLFDPAPSQWGLRGDLFLWMEMRQALCHVQVPEQPEDIAPIIASAFQALTGEPLQPRCDVHVCRLARGGMSSGMVSGRFWSDTFIPLLQSRAGWLQTIWMAPQR